VGLQDLKSTFRRCVNDSIMRQWEEVKQLASTIVFSDEEDCLIWQFHSSGRYTSQSLYGVIKFRGIKPVFTPSIWKIHVRPGAHFFLWLLSKNRFLARDNLSKKQEVPDKCCIFCSELGTANHLFFMCVIAKDMWISLSKV
jgi:hypothetical protein